MRQDCRKTQRRDLPVTLEPEQSLGRTAADLFLEYSWHFEMVSALRP
jgi:hypothetical protein